MTPRRTQQQRLEERRSRKAAEAAQAEAETHGAYRAPPRSECIERSFFISVDDSDTVRIDQRFWRKAGRLVDFVLLLQVPVWDGWETLVRVDCCHGHCHMHPIEGVTDGEARSILRLDKLEDVERAFVVAASVVDGYGRSIRDMRENGDV